MGINKGNVRFVRLTFPESLEDYYQEIGRAGRDGYPATCITLFKFENRSFRLHNIKEIEDEGNKNSSIVVGGSRPSLMICNQPNYILLSILWFHIFGLVFLILYFGNLYVF